MLTPRQLRAARALRLVSRCIGGEIRDARDHDAPVRNRADGSQAATVNKWRRTLEKVGVIFPTTEHGPGVMLRDGLRAELTAIGRPA
jgi:hypothetical protein